MSARQATNFEHSSKDIYNEPYRKTLKLRSTCFATRLSPYNDRIMDAISRILLLCLLSNTTASPYFHFLLPTLSIQSSLRHPPRRLTPSTTWQRLAESKSRIVMSHPLGATCRSQGRHSAFMDSARALRLPLPNEDGLSTRLRPSPNSRSSWTSHKLLIMIFSTSKAREKFHADNMCGGCLHLDNM